MQDKQTNTYRQTDRTRQTETYRQTDRTRQKRIDKQDKRNRQKYIDRQDRTNRATERHTKKGTQEKANEGRGKRGEGQRRNRAEGEGVPNLWCRSSDLCNAQRKQARRCIASATGYGELHHCRSITACRRQKPGRHVRSEQVGSRDSSVLGPSAGVGLPVPLRQKPALDSGSNLRAVLPPRCYLPPPRIPFCYVFKLSDRLYLIYSSVRVCVCVCVRERDRDRERQREREGETDRQRQTDRPVSYTHLTLPTNHRV